MQSSINRIALFQFLVILYCIIGVGLLLKARFGSSVPVMFATHVRDYGFLLLVLPAAWLIWASIEANDPKMGTGDFTPIFASGLLLLGMLICIAFVGTTTALGGGTLVQLKPPPERPMVRSATTE